MVRKANRNQTAGETSPVAETDETAAAAEKNSDETELKVDTAVVTTPTPEESPAMEEIAKEMEKMRSQLEAVIKNAAFEKKERIRLQEQLSHERLKNLSSSSDTPGAASSSLAASNAVDTPGAASSTFAMSNAADTLRAASSSFAMSGATDTFRAASSSFDTSNAADTLIGAASSSLVDASLGLSLKSGTAKTPFMCTSSDVSQNAPYTWSSPMHQPTLPMQMSINPVQAVCSTTSTYTPRVVTYLTPLNSVQPFAPLPHAPSTPADRSQPPLGRSHLSPHSAGNYNGSGRTLQYLPDFQGRPEDWPMFCTAYHESTAMFGYTKVENNFRLQKCIKGEAKEAVESLLIHPNNVDRVMSALEFLYGRPECLLRSQLKKVREIAQIPEGKMELLIPFATKVQNLSTFLEASGLQQHMANPTLIDELVNKLPMSKRMEWAQYSIYVQPYATIKHFDEWLTSVARIVCLVTPSYLPPPVESKPKTRSVLHATAQAVPPSAASNSKCRYCKEKEHPVIQCSAYTKLSIKSKWEFVKKNRLCFSCLRFGHSVRSCRLRKPCGIDCCTRVHHASLHEAQKPISTSSEKSTPEEPATNSLLSCDAERDSKILFRVLPVRLYGAGKTVVRTYALLDEGSSVTLLSAELEKNLNLIGRPMDLRLKWFGKETLTEKSRVVDLKISADIEDAKQYSMEGVHTVPGLSLPTQSVSQKELEPLYRRSGDDIKLPSYAYANPQILIGLDNCHLGTPLRIVDNDDFGPIAAETRLGWIVYGRTSTENHSSAVVLHSSQIEKHDEQLNQLVSDFFNMDSFGVKKPVEHLVSPAEKRALHILSSTTSRFNGRYQMGLLWKSDTFEMPSSYEMAKRRLWGLENKLQREPGFAAAYKGIITSYVNKGYARKLSDAEASVTTARTWYLPHFGVKNPNKPDKIRLVFDAAAKVGDVSLNSFLLKGPDDLKPLLGVLFNFRLRQIAITGDVKEMFHQVVIRSEDQNSQRFLWREDKNNAINIYVMQSMIFGASCSPCSANYVKNLNAMKYTNDHPRAVRSIVDHHYVDDYVDSFDSLAEAVKVTREVISIQKNGGFELRNFASNSQEILRNICDVTEEDKSVKLVDMNVDAVTEKVLGMFWDPVDDVFIFRIKFPRVSQDVIVANRCPTKREFLSLAMSIFDPFGMIANYVIYIKLLLRSIWNHGVEWDESIPNEIFQKWQLWKDELPMISQCRIPRCHNVCLTSVNKVDLHTYVDASEEAFSAVTYFRIEVEGRIFVSFVSGKTKCAPKKLISIPRMELSAAVLGIRLCNSIVEHHALPFGEKFFWSDSKTVIHWLRSEPRRQKQFVAFRIAEVLESSQVSQWRWVPSKLNPADESTRARYPPKYNLQNKWLNGPTYLGLTEEHWPAQPDDVEECICREEMKPKFILLAKAVRKRIFDMSRFSKYPVLLRSVAYVIRFVKILSKKEAVRGEISADEINDAEVVLCQEAQSDAFSDEIAQISRQQQVLTTSSLYKLTPYLDDKGLLRVYGRIDAANTIPHSTKRPIILPKNHRLTTLIVAHYHRFLRHQNDDTIVNEIRQKFWVPSLRTAVRKAKNDCMLCRVRIAVPSPPLMGQLPEDRLTPFVRPFTYAGLDYFGPVRISVGRRQEKRWIALFTCMTVRAVHLEIAADLSTDACILCIRNFVNRRGVPKRIRSDNGTNFLGAKNELLTAEIFDTEAIKLELSTRRIEWVFNCPLNPHAGGCWERLVRSVKRVLTYSLHELAPRPETLYSALIEAENIVNSRPLTHLPVSTEDEDPLTPNHFLLGCPNSTQTPGPEDPKILCLRKQWRVSQQIKNRFWKKWMQEYLPMLTRRCKWFQRVSPLTVGDLVLICDADVARSEWRRGKITKVYLGKDEQVRSAEVKTATGVFRRPAVKLAKLDVGEASAEDRAPHGGWGVTK